MKTCPRCNGQFEDAVRFCPRDGIALPEVTDPLVGQVLLGQFEVVQSAGRGAMGTVYRARQTTMDREVAIKVLRKDLLRDPAVIKRFQREARAVARLQHPNIVTVFLIGETPDGRPYLVMEYVDGESLAAICTREGAMPPARAIGIGRQIGSALGEAHAAGVVHRDLKPENIIIGTRRRTADFVKVLDFGIAKIVGAKSDMSQLTRTGAIFGTPHYIAPEQASGGEVDHRADLYSLGVILFRMLTGRLPFDGTGGMQVLLAHIREQPPRPRDLNPELSGELEDVVLRALAKDPAARWQSADELTAALDRVPDVSPNQLPSPRATWAGVGAPALAMIQSAARTSPINPPARAVPAAAPPAGTGRAVAAVPVAVSGGVAAMSGARPLSAGGTAQGVGAPVPATAALPAVAMVPVSAPANNVGFPANAAELAYAGATPTPARLPSTVAAQPDDSLERPAPNRGARLAGAALLIVLVVGGAAVAAGYLARERVQARPVVPAPVDAAAQRALQADAGAPGPAAPVHSNVETASLAVDGYQLRVSCPTQLQALTDTTFYVDVRDPAGRPLESAKLTLGVRGTKPKDKELKCPGKASALPGRYAAECALKEGGAHRVTVYLRVGGKERKQGFDVAIGEAPEAAKAAKGRPAQPEKGKPKGKGPEPPAPPAPPPAWPQPQPQPQPQPPPPQPQPQPQPPPPPEPPPVVEPPARPPELPPAKPPPRKPRPDDIYQLLDGGA